MALVRLIESCPQGVLQTERVVIQPESSGWGLHNIEDSQFTKLVFKTNRQSPQGIMRKKEWLHLSINGR